MERERAGCLNSQNSECSGLWLCVRATCWKTAFCVPLVSFANRFHRGFPRSPNNPTTLELVSLRAGILSASTAPSTLFGAATFCTGFAVKSRAFLPVFAAADGCPMKVTT